MSVPNQIFYEEGKGLGSWLTGIGRAILGKPSAKFNFNRNFVAQNQRVILVDVSFNGLLQVAQNVPHLNVVISRGAEMFSNMEVKHLDKNGEEVEDSPVLKLLNKPNPLQSLEQFLYDFYINNAVYSSAFGYKNYASALAEIPSVLWWLPSGWVKINATGKLYRQYKIEDIIESYSMLYDPQEFKPNEIIHISEGISQSKLTGASKIEALQLPLSNIMAALKSNNIILTERGLIGFISSDAKDTNGMAMPMTPDERKKFESQYQNDRSLDSEQSHVMITGASIKWNPMTFDVKQLMLYEGLEDSFGQICGAYGIDRDIFPSVKGATNENKEMGLKATIQNTMQPLGNKLMNKLAEEFKLTDKGEKLVASWNHMPVMQADELQLQQSEFQKSQALTLQLKDGAISLDEYRLSLGRNPDQKLVEQSQQDKILTAQAALRSTVGGAEALVAINAAVSSRQMDRDPAVAMVIQLFGFEPAIADSMVTKTINQPQPPTPPAQ